MGNDVRWLDAEQQRAWRAWLDAHAGLSARLNRELQADRDCPRGLRRARPRDGRAGGTAAPCELGDGLQWEKSWVSRQVSRMAERGLVAKEVAPEDGRGAYVTLTRAGRRAIEDAARRTSSWCAGCSSTDFPQGR